MASVRITEMNYPSSTSKNQNKTKPTPLSQLHGQMPILLYTVTTEVCPKVLHALGCFPFFQKPQEVKENRHQILQKVKQHSRCIDQKQPFLLLICTNRSLVLHRSDMQVRIFTQCFGNTSLIYNIKLSSY